MNEARKAATKWAGKQDIKSRAHREILRALAWVTAGHGAVSHQTLMRRTKTSRRTVIRAIGEFLAKGLVSIERQRGARGRQGANLYTLHILGKPAARVPNRPQIQSAKMAPLSTEVVIYQGKNEPCESGSTVGDWDGGWPPPDPWLGWPGPNPDAMRGGVAA